MTRLKFKDTRNLKMAVVGTEPIIDPARFAETVARNRGTNGIVTTDLAKAQAWLGIDSANT